MGPIGPLSVRRLYRHTLGRVVESTPGRPMVRLFDVVSDADRGALRRAAKRMGVEIKKTVEEGPGGGNPEYIVRADEDRVAAFLGDILGSVDWFYSSVDAGGLDFDDVVDAGD